MDVRITMSTEPDWVVKVDGETQPGECARQVWKSITDAAALEGYMYAGGGTSAESRQVVINPAHVRTVHEIPDRSGDR